MTATEVEHQHGIAGFCKEIHHGIIFVEIRVVAVEQEQQRICLATVVFFRQTEKCENMIIVIFYPMDLT